MTALIHASARAIIQTMRAKQPRIALLHRYGLAGWICCGGHSIPRMIEVLCERGYEVHVFGPRSADVLPEGVGRNVVLHELGYTWDRANPTHKWSRTILWFLVLPWLCLRCRLMGMAAVLHIDDTLPLTGWILRIFYGRRFALTIMDFFCRIYTEKHPVLRPLGRFVEWLDVQSWKFTPVLFTKVFFTQKYLAEHGVARDRMFIARNPCNHTIFCPLPDEEKQAARERLGFSEQDFVLTHHGIMHPNKGNDWILHRIAELQDDIPGIKYLLMGDGPEMDNITQLARDLNITDRILLPGWVPSEQALNESLNAADVGIAMRIGQETDHFHMTDTVSHEMACGKPLLAVRLTGIAEIVQDGENGFLFGADDPDEFKSKLLQLYRDRDLRQRLGAAALKTSRAVSDLEVCAHQVADPIIALVEKET